MSIFQCPTCGGYGWIPQGCRDVGWYETNGHLRRVMTNVGELLAPTDKPLPDTASFQRCWCNGELWSLSEKLGRPLYWRDEQSGHLRAAVEKLLHHESLAPSELDLLRGYVAQWVLGIQRLGHMKLPDYQDTPREAWLEPLASAQDAGGIMQVVMTLVEYGLDPL